MTITNTVDVVTSWAKREICEEIRLKVPPEIDDANDEKYNHKMVTPACFPLFVPSKEKLPPKILTPLPSMCVRIIEGSDNLKSNESVTTLEFAFCTWSPGTYGNDIVKPIGSGKYEFWSEENSENYFKRNGEGWRDAWNWVDIALRKLESTSSIGGIALDRKTEIKYGPLKEQEGIPDYYPFWFAWIQFAVKNKLMRNNPEWDEFL